MTDVSNISYPEYDCTVMWVLNIHGVCSVNVEYSYAHVDREQKDYVNLSFSTISAVGSNAAINHYRFKIDNILLSECCTLFCFKGCNRYI